MAGHTYEARPAKQNGGSTPSKLAATQANNIQQTPQPVSKPARGADVPPSVKKPWAKRKGLLKWTLAALAVLAAILALRVEELHQWQAISAVSNTMSDSAARVTDMMKLSTLTSTLNTGSLNILENLNISIPNDISGQASTLWKELVAQLPSLPGTANQESVLRPGLVLAEQGYVAKHPIVIIPGFVSSGLELWHGHPCARKYFRQRMWGEFSMLQTFLLNSSCWFEHLALDPQSGLDPAGIKIRSALGLEAVDYFVQGYWVWGKMVEALSDVGYDPNSLVSMAYDWRLAIPLLEVRDGYFTRLKLAVEALQLVSGDKVVVVAHSFGENVFRAFLLWVEHLEPGWTEKRLEGIVNIAGPTLGVPKVLSAMLSGELKDTAQLGSLAGYLAENFLSRTSRSKLFRSWGSLFGMLPDGGSKIWGTPEGGAPDDDDIVKGRNRTFGSMVSVWPTNWQQLLNEEQGLDTPGTDCGSDADEPCPAAAAAAAIKKGSSEATTKAVAAAAAHPVNMSSAEVVKQAVDKAAEKMHLRRKKADGEEVEEVDDEDSGPAATTLQRLSSLNLTDMVYQWLPSGKAEKLHPANLSQRHVHPLNVDEGLQLMVDVVGPTVGQHFREWAAVTKEEIKKARAEGSTFLDSTFKRFSGTSQGEQSVTSDRTIKSLKRHPAAFPSSVSHPMPNAPSLKFYCFYGVGKPTERSFHYVVPPTPPSESGANGSHSKSTSTAGDSAKKHANASETNHFSDSTLGAFDWHFLYELHQPEHKLENGVQLTNGDGTVPLMSLGLMCNKGWKSKRLNPGQFKIVTKEFKHDPVPFSQDSRGGPNTADHVDILGNEGMLMSIIKIACGKGHELQNEIHSDIENIGRNIDFENGFD